LSCLTRLFYLIRELGNDYEATRLEALRWISVLLERHRTEVSLFFTYQIITKWF
jgi:hypothetical protein